MGKKSLSRKQQSGWWACAVLLPGLLLAACGPVDNSNATVEDDLGRRVRLAGTVKRVISLAPNATEILFFLGKGDCLVGGTRHCDFPPAARQLPRVGGMINPDLETVLRLRPDLVIASYEGNSPGLAQSLAKLGIPLYVLRINSVASLTNSLARLAGVLSCGNQARLALRGLTRQLQSLEGTLAGRSLLVHISGEGPVFTFGKNTLVADLIRLAGGHNQGDLGTGNFPTLDREWLYRHRPTLVLVVEDPASVNGRQALAFWRQQAPEARVVFGDRDALSRPGPRTVSALIRVADRL